MLDLKFVLPDELISIIKFPGIGSILVLGGSDTGKTTLIESLIRIFQDRFSLAVVDCDVGQSHIGPPTTIAWSRVEEGFNRLQDMEMEDFYFVGDISPSGNIYRCLEGAEFIFKKAKSYAEKVIIDTSGYINTEEAIDFKVSKIQLLKPEVIIALQRGNELEQILEHIDTPSVFRIAVPVEVKQKSFPQRSLYREARFKEYFSSATEICFSKGIFTLPQQALIDRLVGLRNFSGRYLALGIIRRITEGDIFLLTPLKETKDVHSIIIGAYRLQGLSEL